MAARTILQVIESRLQFSLLCCVHYIDQVLCESHIALDCVRVVCKALPQIHMQLRGLLSLSLPLFSSFSLFVIGDGSYWLSSETNFVQQTLTSSFSSQRASIVSDELESVQDLKYDVCILNQKLCHRWLKHRVSSGEYNFLPHVLS